jgi:hypothetical protein
MTFTVGKPFAPVVHWSQWGDRVVVAAWDDDRVDIFDAGRWRRSLRLTESPQAIDEGAAVRMLEAAGYVGPCRSSSAEVVRKHGFHPRFQQISNLRVAPDGAVWVERRENGRVVAEVFDSTGAVLGVLPAGFPFPLAFLPDGRALIAVRDTVDVERLGFVHWRR